MKKIGLICLLLVIAFGTVGVAHAKWSQALNVNNTAGAGTFDIRFGSFTAPSPNPSYGANFSATVSPDGHSCTVAATNLYPGLDGMFAFTLKDAGSVPATITGIYIKQNGTTVAGGINPTGALPLKLGYDATNDINVTISGISPGTVIPANGSGPVAGHLLIHTWALSPDGNDANGGASGSFVLEIDTAQKY